MDGRRPMRFLLAAMAVLAVWSTLWLLGSLGEDQRLETILPSPPSPPLPATGTGRAPLALADGYLCAPGWPYAGYNSRSAIARARRARAGRYYPPNHPLLPPRTVRPDRCYATQGDAEAAGHALAPPPSDGLVVDSVYLVRVDLDGQCLRAARRVGFGVPCPTRLPNAGAGSDPARCGDIASLGRFTRPPCVYEGEFLLDQAGFAVPPGYGEGIVGGSHLVITAVRGEDPSVAPRILKCPQARIVASSVVRPWNASRHFPALVVACPQGSEPFEDYLVLGWSDSGVVYQVAVKGDALVNRHLLDAIALNLRIVGPGSARGQP
jgi:hypothetical protein